MRARVVWVLLAATLLVASGCRRSIFEAPQMQGPAAMVESGGHSNLWLLSKQEEKRMVSVFGGGTRGTANFRTDTFCHFNVEATAACSTATRTSSASTSPAAS